MNKEGKRIIEAANRVFAQLDALIGDSQFSEDVELLRRFVFGTLEVPIGGEPAPVDDRGEVLAYFMGIHHSAEAGGASTRSATDFAQEFMCVPAPSGEPAPVKSLHRHDWGGIEADEKGRRDLQGALTVLEFLDRDYSAMRDQAPERAKPPYRDWVAAIWRVKEMVEAAISREAEYREHLLTEDCDD